MTRSENRAKSGRVVRARQAEKLLSAEQSIELNIVSSSPSSLQARRNTQLRDLVRVEAMYGNFPLKSGYRIHIKHIGRRTD